MPHIFYDNNKPSKPNDILKNNVYIPLRPLTRQKENNGYEGIKGYDLENPPTVRELLKKENLIIKAKTIAALSSVQNKDASESKGSWHGSKYGKDYGVKTQYYYGQRQAKSAPQDTYYTPLTTNSQNIYEKYLPVDYYGSRNLNAPPLSISDFEKAFKEKQKKKRKLPFAAALAAEVACVVAIAVFVLAPLTKPRAETILPAAAEKAITEPLQYSAPPARTQVPSASPTPTPMLSNMAQLYAKNKDLAGWLKIDGTPIDYPVMYRPADKEFYLYRDFDGQKDKTLQGSLYIDESNTLAPRDTNLLIHGHNMKNGTMFHALENYKDESFFRQHPQIRFNTLYEEQTYEVFAAFTSRVYEEDDSASFVFYEFLNAKNPEAFNKAMEAVRGLALYSTGITPRYGDELITLSTCEYSTENGRMVVMARKVA